MTNNDDSTPPQLRLLLKVVSTHTIDDPTKYVVYKLKVSKEGDTTIMEDHAGFLDRRYTDYLELYTKLYQEFPEIFSSYAFPKKAVVGNFSPKTISYRSEAFEALLTLIANNEKVRESSLVIDFFHQKELMASLKHIRDENYPEAVTMLKNSFYVLNHILMPRHPHLLRLLCLLVACCHAAAAQETRHYAMTAVQRFEAVSDTELLRYYVPLLQLCVGLLQNGDKELLQERLSSMKRRGMKVDGCPTLLEAVLADLS